MDDGWFGNRNDDTSSLDDWDVNPKKLPGGLKSLADKVNNLGLQFGIWVEPEMQQNYSYGYPMSTVTAHVSACPNHQTLRITPIETRFNIAAFGVFGYECNLCDMSSEDLDKIRTQIAIYKVHKLVAPNLPTERYAAEGLAADKVYHFYNHGMKHNLKCFGDLVNIVSTVHIKQDSLVHNVIAHFVKMQGETEDYDVCGDTLMHNGVLLKQGFAGTGYNEQVRYYQDFASRMYFMEEV